MPKSRRATRKSGGFFGLFDGLFNEKKNEGNSQVAMPVSEAPSNSSVVMGGKRKSRKGRKASRKSRKASRKSRKAGRR